MNILKMFTAEETAELIGATVCHLQTLRGIGVIKGIRTGRGFMFSQKAICDFQHDYEGRDVSNERMARLNFSLVQKEKAELLENSTNQKNQFYINN